MLIWCTVTHHIIGNELVLMMTANVNPVSRPILLTFWVFLIPCSRTELTQTLSSSADGLAGKELIGLRISIILGCTESIAFRVTRVWDCETDSGCLDNRLRHRRASSLAGRRMVYVERAMNKFTLKTSFLPETSRYRVESLEEQPVLVLSCPVLPLLEIGGSFHIR